MSSIKDDSKQNFKSAIKSLETYSENFNYQKNYQNFLVQNLIHPTTLNQDNILKDERLKCKHCGILFNNFESLKVHMQYQHDDQNRWNVQRTPASTVIQDTIVTTAITPTPSTPTTTTSVSEQGINSELGLSNPSGNSNENCALEQNNNDKTHTVNHHSTTVSAADSSDNQPGTPQPITSSSSVSNHLNENNYHQSYSTGSLLHQQESMHPYPGGPPGSAGYPTMHPTYEQFYHHPPIPNMDYGLYPGTGGTQQHLPTSRYHSYLNHMTHGNGPTVSSMTNNSLSPRVSSSSPTTSIITPQNSQDSPSLAQITSNGNSTPQPPTGQPTPSPSPKQCDKCGFVCPTDAQLSEHYVQVHNTEQNVNTSLRSEGRSGNEEDSSNTHLPYPYGGQQQQQQQQQQFIKDEPSADILDLDSQKMVYPPGGPESINPQDQPLPPMHSMHPMHRPMMWGSEMHSNYMPPNVQPTEMKQSYYPPPPVAMQKSPYPGMNMGGLKQEYPMPGSGPSFSGQMIKSEYHHSQSIAPQTRPSTETSSGNNPVSSSPSEFPSTTTPQENGTNGSQFRGFEPPTSSLSAANPAIKATTWKSNEARRPKTYNCTACNKWFTSSGHLKRHYNTTLHKNAVKSSGQPDPATMPISAHHHPTRDPNYKHRSRHSRQQPPPNPPEPPRSPEYTPQYTPQGTSFGQQQQQYQQQSSYNSAPLNSTNSNGHPNGQAGPSVQTSQPRGLQILSNMEANQSNLHLDQEDQVHSSSNSNQLLNSPREELYQHQHNSNQDHQSSGELMVPNSSPNNQMVVEDQQPQLQLRPLSQHQQQQAHIISHHPTIREVSRIRQDIMGHHHHHPIIHSTTPMHPNTIMDPDYISPLGINPTHQGIPVSIHTTNTIPSYHLQQLEDQHQQNYHTIIGNDLISDQSDETLLQMGSFHSTSSLHSSSPTMMSSPNMISSPNVTPSPPLQSLQIFSSSDLPIFDSQYQTPQYLQTTTDGTLQIVTSITGATTSPARNTQITTLNPSFVDLHRLSGGTAHYQENITQPYSPAVPDYLNQANSPMSTNGERKSPETYLYSPYGTILSSEHGSTTSPTFPYSPTISSTVTTSNSFYQFQDYVDQNLFSQQPLIQTANIIQPIAVKQKKPRKPPAKKRKLNETVTSSSVSSIASSPALSPASSIASSTTVSSTPSTSGTPQPVSTRVACIPCNKTFAKNCYLTQHNKSFHNGFLPFRCTKCGKRFKEELIYLTHCAKHTAKVKPYQCALCPKHYFHKTDLRRHMEVHTKKKSNYCPTCEKGFCRKDHLVKHENIHTRPPKDPNAKKPKISDANDPNTENQIENVTETVIQVNSNDSDKVNSIDSDMNENNDIVNQ